MILTRSPQALLLALAAGLLTACGGDKNSTTTGPGPEPAALRAQSGSSQTGTVGSVLATALSVLVTDGSGKPIVGARVEWDAAAGSGSVSPSASSTDSRGIAQAIWTLGTVSGTARATAQVSGVNPVVFSATALPGAAAAVIASPELVNLGVGDTIRVRATVRDRFGNDLSAETVGFSSLDPAIAAISADGLVSAVAVGNARIVATSGARADTVPVLVLPAGASACGSTAPRVLALGEVFIPGPSAASVSVCLGAADDVNGEYALTLISTAASYSATTPLDVSGVGVTGPTTVLITSAPDASAGATASGDFPTSLSSGAFLDGLKVNADPVRSAELARRTLERRELAALAPTARDWYRQSQSSTSATSSIQQAVEARVGDIVKLNANANVACSSPNTRSGRVAAVGNRVVVVADTGNPAGGYTDAEYASIAATFDTLVYPLDTTAFGAPSNISQYGKIILFYTRSVNQLTPSNAGYTIGGFFFARDLYPKTAKNGLQACTSSNEQEMFYLLVPDPNGLVNGNKRTKDMVTLLNLGTIAHEFQHLINSSRRLYVTPNAQVAEETWLDEGLSHIAEELLFFRVSGYTSRQNLTLADIQRQSANFTNYASQNFARFYGYLTNPEITSPYAPNDSLSTRGATWNFLRYSAGRQGAGGEAGFFHSVVNSSTTGFANLNNATGGQIGDYLRDWTVSVIADDFSAAETAALDAKYILPAWNFRNIYPGLRFSGGTPLGVYPIAARRLTNNSTQRITLAGGTSSYVRFGIRSGGSAQLTFSSNGSAVPGTLRYAIVRLR